MKAALALFGAALIAVVPLVGSDFYVTLFNYIGIFTLVALGLVLLTGAGGLTSFGQAAFFGIGAYCTAWYTTRMGGSPWLGLALATAVTVLSAAVIGVFTLRLSGHYLPVATLAWGIAIFFLFGNLEMLGRYTGISNIPPVAVGTLTLHTERRIYYLIWVIVGLSMLAATNLLQSRKGRAIASLRGGSVLAESLGVNAFGVKLAVFLLAGGLAGIAGWLYAHLQRFISPEPFGINAGIEFLFMAVLGGAGSVLGALVGSTLVNLLKNVLQDVLPLITTRGGNFEIVVYGMLFILVLQHSRGGLVPTLMRRLPRRHPPPPKAERRLPARQRPKSGELLQVHNVTKRFGGLVAVNEVSLTLNAGEILAVIGPNGAGKSTLFNLISGALKPTSGSIRLLGETISRLPAMAIARLGVARTFQHVKLRPGMTLLDNVAMGAYLRGRSGYWQAMLRLDREEEQKTRAEAMAHLIRVGLGDDPYELAGNLPLGKQRLLEVARSLAADPMLIMLDEPAAGLRRREKVALAELIRSLKADGVTVLLVEHDMEFVMGLVDRLVVLQFGTKLAEGTPAEIRANPAVQEAYLGGVA
jgi:ABC-type branched-subunit amino acid transport system ATPase component/ABC-type branched-subunit amino acid transport system permease subunit